MIVAEQLSVAVAWKVITALQLPVGKTTLIAAGQVITGGWLSTTVTVNEQVAVCPLPSVAVAVTVVAPSAKVLPDAGL